jgi:hypothetical protein
MADEWASQAAAWVPGGRRGSGPERHESAPQSPSAPTRRPFGSADTPIAPAGKMRAPRPRFGFAPRPGRACDQWPFPGLCRALLRPCVTADHHRQIHRPAPSPHSCCSPGKTGWRWRQHRQAHASKNPLIARSRNPVHGLARSIFSNTNQWLQWVSHVQPQPRTARQG